MNASIRLILTMLKVTLVDGPSVYGSIHSAIEDIERVLANEPEGLTLGKVDSILRENNVDTEEIEATYVGNY
jgi:hypothetical protein